MDLLAFPWMELEAADGCRLLGGDLGLQCRSQHLTRAIADDLSKSDEPSAVTPFASESLPS